MLCSLMEQLIDKWNANNETDKEFQIQGSKPVFLINIFLMPSSELMAVRSKLLNTFYNLFFHEAFSWECGAAAEFDDDLYLRFTCV